MKVDIGISEKNREGSAAILNDLLCDEVLLYVKSRNFHWNVAGPHFSELHKFFEAQYESLDEILDDVAERARSLGVTARGTLSEFSKNARLKEYPGQVPGAKEMLRELTEDHEELICLLREDLVTCAEKFKDMGTSDFLTGLMEKHEKMAWMLRSFLG